MDELLKNEIIGKALDLYRDGLDIKIDVNDFMNVAICTLNAIRELDYRVVKEDEYVSLYKDKKYISKQFDKILLESYIRDIQELMLKLG